jgi:hypothetical protein
MIPPVADRERLACWSMGRVEYVVESRRHGHVEKWLVPRPNRDFATRYRSACETLPQGCRIVVDADSLQPVGILATEVSPPTSHSAGFNPYFDLPPS